LMQNKISKRKLKGRWQCFLFLTKSL
jgi:hypothetical protein